MRIWSLHPKHLDTKGLVALWRESLLARHVLEGKTRGYKNHPQLNRFRKTKYPVDLINQYLVAVYQEAVRRNFNFNKQKISRTFRKSKIPVTMGQLNYEAAHLLAKLKKRDPGKYKELKSKSTFENHPVFKRVAGEIEEWEIVADTWKNAAAKKAKARLHK
jgi:Pyrimidine dimer DNA glycosylase